MRSVSLGYSWSFSNFRVLLAWETLLRLNDFHRPHCHRSTGAICGAIGLGIHQMWSGLVEEMQSAQIFLLMRMPTRAIWTSKESAARVHHLIQNRTRVNDVHLAAWHWEHPAPPVHHEAKQFFRYDWSKIWYQQHGPNSSHDFFGRVSSLQNQVVPCAAHHTHTHTHTPDCKGIVDETLDRSVMILWSVLIQSSQNVSQLQHKKRSKPDKKPLSPPRSKKKSGAKTGSKKTSTFLKTFRLAAGVLFLTPVPYQYF